MRRRLPPAGTNTQLVNVKPFLQPPLFLYTLASFVCFLGLWTGVCIFMPCRQVTLIKTALTFIDVSAIDHGVSAEFSFYLVSIVNAAAAIGRISAGILSDRFGAFELAVSSLPL